MPLNLSKLLLWVVEVRLGGVVKLVVVIHLMVLEEQVLVVG
jgi:hypothetical protein